MVIIHSLVAGNHERPSPIALISSQVGVRMDFQLKNAKEWMIIIDLDGTIVDSEAANFSVLNQVIEEFGYGKHRTTILKGIAEGKTAEEIMKMIDMTSETKEKMEKRTTSLLREIPTLLFPDVVENLKALKDMGLLLCIATDNNIHIVSRVISEYALKEVFEPNLILTKDTYPIHKPSPDVVKELMKRSGRKKAIIVGDTPKEVALARNSGCPAVIITDGDGFRSERARRKQTFEYEWETYGEFSGKDIYTAHNWREVKNVITDIVRKETGRRQS